MGMVARREQYVRSVLVTGSPMPAGTGARRTWLCRALAALTTLLLAVAPTGCGGAEATKSAAPFTIGVVLDLSGPAKAIGSEQQQTLELAADMINKRGGVDGQDVRLVVHDDASSPVKAAELAEKLAADKEISLLIGSTSTASTQAMRPVAEKAEIPMIAPTAGEGIDASSRWIFTTGLDSGIQVDALLDYLKSAGVTTLALLLEDSGASSGVSEAARAAAAATGVSILAEVAFDPAAPDASGPAQDVVQDRPQAVLVWGSGAGTTGALSAYRSAGGTGVAVTGAAVGSPDWPGNAGPAAQGVVATVSRVLVADQLGAEDPAAAAAKDFVTQFSGQYGKTPSVFAGYAYDALRLATQAADTAGSDRVKLRNALNATGQYVGVTGTFTITAEKSTIASNSVVLVSSTDSRWTMITGPTPTG